MLKFKFIFVNTFSLFKRLFYFNSLLYNCLTFIPLIMVIRKRYKYIHLILFFIVFLLITLNRDYVYMFPLILLISYKEILKKYDFNFFIQNNFVFLVIVLIYGIVQKYIGYLPFEIEWIKTGLGTVREEGYFVTKDIRPFSVFAGVPDFAFFVSLFLYHYLFINKKKIIGLFLFIIIFFIGSRGVFVSVSIAILLTLLFKNENIYSIITGFVLSIIVYLILIFGGPLINTLLDNVVNENSRYFVYGTFNARIVMLEQFLNNVNIRNLVLGSDKIFIYDNIYFHLINKFGFIILLIYLTFIFARNNNYRKNVYFKTILISYGFYADVILDFYFMYNYFIAYYTIEYFYRTNKCQKDSRNNLVEQTLINNN